MKKVLVSLLMAMVLGTTLTACGSSNEGSKVEQGSGQELSMSVSDVVKKIEEAGYIRMPMPIEEDMAKEVYFIDTDVVEEYAISKTGISPGSDFVMVVKAKDGKVDEAKANMQKALDGMVANAFYPDEKEAAENAKIEVKGNYVSLFILNEEVAADAQKLYEDSFK